MDQKEWSKMLKEGKSLIKEAKKPTKANVTKDFINAILDYIDDELLNDLFDYYDLDAYEDEGTEVLGWMNDITNKIKKIK